jgi:hypothetical protein
MPAGEMKITMGFAFARDLVLTASYGTWSQEAEVRFIGAGTPIKKASVVWEHEKMGICLLQLSGEEAALDKWRRFGQFDRKQRVRWEGALLRCAGDRAFEGGVSPGDLALVSGDTAPTDGSDSDILRLTTDVALPDLARGARSFLGGIVFLRGYLVGFITSTTFTGRVDQDPYLSAIPLSRLMEDHSFRVRLDYPTLWRVLAGGIAVQDRSAEEITSRYHYRNFAPKWKGDFNVPGRGAGNVRIGVQGSLINVLVDCDLFDWAFVDKGLADVTMVIGPKGAVDPADWHEVPLMVAIEGAHPENSLYGRYVFSSPYLPARKYLAVSIDADALKDMSRGHPLSFYIRAQTKDGQTLWITKDGQPFQNFEIEPGELKPG